MPTTTRITWWAFFAVVPLALLIVLLVARPAAAFTIPTGPYAGPSLSVSDTEEEGEEENEGEESEDEESEEEENEGEEGDSAPAECLLQTARAQAFAYPTQNRLRLSIHYTAIEPAETTIAYRLNGGKGSMKFTEPGQHLGRAGSIRLSESLSDSQVAKVSAADSFTVELQIAATPRSCRRFDTRHLNIEHGGGHRLTWMQSESNFGT
jgi:hypothetical protein